MIRVSFENVLLEAFYYQRKVEPRRTQDFGLILHLLNYKWFYFYRECSNKTNNVNTKNNCQLFSVNFIYFFKGQFVKKKKKNQDRLVDQVWKKKLKRFILYQSHESITEKLSISRKYSAKPNGKYTYIVYLPLRNELRKFIVHEICHFARVKPINYASFNEIEGW